MWSPKSRLVKVQVVGQDVPIAMEKSADGYHQIEIDGVGPGDRYFYRFDELPPRPDPASRYQPEGVHGPSEVVSRDFGWTDQDWSGIERDDWVIYELHIGTFTDQGTFVAAIDRLDELIDLGITAIELMPVADAPGKWNWGYDGVNLFAPNRNYGTPDDLRRLVDAAHAKGLAVFLDVVYNHLGPEGNYLGEIGPYLSRSHRTPWGAGPNFDGARNSKELRRFFVSNVIAWFDEYHFDALRVDAVHCMIDQSEKHVVVEMAEAVQRYRNESGRPARLIAESNIYNAAMTTATDAGGCGFDAQWSDCFLHSVFSTLRPGEQLTDREYRSANDLDQVLRSGYIFSGDFGAKPIRQSPTDRVDTSTLIYSIQNHDFIGNHPLGVRLHQLASPAVQRAAAAMLILSPAIPMLFMGEEFACDQPFQFFVDFSDSSLRRSVVKGRRREYPQHDWSEGSSPVKPAAFHDSKIGNRADGDASMVDWYRSLISLRKQWISSGLLCDANLQLESDPNQGVFVMRYRDTNQSVAVVVRLNPIAWDAAPIPLPIDGKVVLDSNKGDQSQQLQANHAIVVRVASD
ncbi:malto-oligosyltrehalose trehalohydrolase [Rubripirellula obstinata]|uniref:malto-oligosyltrehalose trehalohydrolase n=1 Tax=Rubripirellula obstinata TaxID=406547 RepID=UPI001356D530|nr:malto-oligosyltrehalose trehalohydrolase [Rubripirellula obstinata]